MPWPAISRLTPSFHQFPDHGREDEGERLLPPGQRIVLARDMKLSLSIVRRASRRDADRESGSPACFGPARDVPRGEGVRRVDNGDALKIDVHLGELRTYIIYVVGHAAQDVRGNHALTAEDFLERPRDCACPCTRRSGNHDDRMLDGQYPGLRCAQPSRRLYPVSPRFRIGRAMGWPAGPAFRVGRGNLSKDL